MGAWAARWGAVVLAGLALVTATSAAAGAPAPGAMDEKRLAFQRYRSQLDAVMAGDGTLAGPSTGVPNTVAGAPGSTTASPCHLYQPGAANAPASECVSCHRGTAGVSHSHPVDVDYESLRLGGRGTALRTAADVVSRGVLLPEGQIRCATCHDGHSPWMYRIALPPTAEVRPAANMADHASYEADRRPPTAPPPLRAGQAVPPLPPQLKPGSMVSPTPLCMACHAFD